MRHYTESERREHVENWKNGGLSKKAYARSAGILPTTFYTWVRGKESRSKDFEEIRQKVIPKNPQGIIIEKDGITVRIPLSMDVKELENVFIALWGA